MIVTFPHMGNIYIPTKILFDTLEIDYIIPPQNNKKALEIGASLAPEEMCLPFKIMLGNYIQSIQKGADTIILVGSCGPCRFGEYCELQMRILKKSGYDVEFIVFDAPKDIGIKELFKRTSRLSSNGKAKNINKSKALPRAIKAMKLLDAIEKKVHFLAGYEINTGESKKMYYQCIKETVKEKNPKEAIKILSYYKNKIDKLPIDYSKEPLKVAIIGEIYTIIDPFSNLSIEEKLMDYGVSSFRKITPSWWIKDAALKLFKVNSLDLKYHSKDYLPINIGGHARECIGEAMIANRNNLDGAIQIFPMGCMPEIVSKAILPNVSKDNDFPIMSLVVDEMTGEAGYITRIEAFLDLLERRKNNVLFGN